MQKNHLLKCRFYRLGQKWLAIWYHLVKQNCWFFRWFLLRVLRNDEAALAEPLSEPASAATFAFPAEPMEPGKNDGSKRAQVPL